VAEVPIGEGNRIGDKSTANSIATDLRVRRLLVHEIRIGPDF
jgi:hypothetical protein